MARKHSSLDLITDLPVRTAPEAVAEAIQMMVQAGELAPGDKLPPERVLTAQLGVSRMTLRMALNTLEALGYVKTLRGAHGGTFVSELSVPFARWLELTRQNQPEVEELIELRAAVEAGSAALAAERRSEADLDAMAVAIEHFRLGTTRASIRQGDTEFHNAIALAARNKKILDLVRATRAQEFSLVHMESTQGVIEFTQDIIDVSVIAHQAILEAIRDQNPAVASAEMAAHVNFNRCEMRFFLGLEENPYLRFLEARRSQ